MTDLRPFSATTLDRRPELEPAVDRLITGNVPEFMTWESPGNWRRYRLYDTFPTHQYRVLDEREQLVAAANRLPVHWDGTVDGLPEGSDGVLVSALSRTGHDSPNTLCMLSVSVAPRLRGTGTAERLLGPVIRQPKDTAPTDTPEESPMPPLRPAAVGCGAAARSCHLTALIDPDPEQAEAALDRYRELGGTSRNVRVARCADESSDASNAAVVAVPHTSHATAARDLPARGKHVLLEKPMATSASDAEALAGALPVTGGPGVCNAVYVDDVADAPVAALTASHVTEKRFLLNGPGTVGRGDFFDRVRDLRGLTAPAGTAPGPPRVTFQDGMDLTARWARWAGYAAGAGGVGR
ncbi:Gfo/Idh/MocA family oxidoreductase [Streptomyces sp. NBC_01261]|uniref:Gfo/Idh/MocA family oxidoreductase n=1 Tax=Streptomyces sp. NBC_01261 TaxID=2903802 RepID=UPI002E316B07|nr:Gfo/Idh/MocA family oxidoreductase [Streptomyces sp. NBC_01261]